MQASNPTAFFAGLRSSPNLVSPSVGCLVRGKAGTDLAAYADSPLGVLLDVVILGREVSAGDVSRDRGLLE